MIIEENWAISIERARRFWESQPDVTKDADGLLPRQLPNHPF